MPDGDLRQLASVEEIGIGFRWPDGSVGSTPGWVLQAGEVILVRSIRGRGGGWYRRLGSCTTPRAVLAMLVLELAGPAVLQWQHGRLQAGSRQGALAIVETMHDARVVVIGADGSIEVRAGPGASAS
jgi:hypothetical protein